jgi:hypothetical protein
MTRHLIVLALLTITASARSVEPAAGDSDWARNAPATIAGDPGAYSDAGPTSAYPGAGAKQDAPDLAATLDRPNGVAATKPGPPCVGSCDVPEPLPTGLLPSGLLALYLMRRLLRSPRGINRA